MAHKSEPLLLKSNRTQGGRTKSLWQQIVDGPWVYVFSILFFFIVVSVWQYASGPGNLINPVLLPEPTKILSAIKFLVTSGFFYEHIAATTFELILGFIIAVVSGLALGIVFSLIPPIQKVLQPYIIMFSTTPKVAFIPLIMTWFGFGAPSKIIVAATLAFFPIFVNTMAGMARTPEDSRRLMYSYGGTAWQQFKMLQFPNALPAIMTGVNMGFTFAVVGVVVGEFQGARVGMGYLIEVFTFQLNIDRTFAVVILLSILAYIIYAIIERLTHRIVFWIREERITTGTL